MATFLSLVNDTMREAGADIDQLSTIITTGNTIQSKFCNWVIQSWEEIQTDYNAWSFMKTNAVVYIYPRIHFYDGTTSYATNTSMEDVLLTGEDWDLSGYSSLTILYFDPADASAISTPTEGYIDLKVVPDAPLDFSIPVGLELTTPDTAAGRTFKGYFKHWGHYNLGDTNYPFTGQGVSTDTSDISEVDWNSFRMFDDAETRPAASGNYLNYNDSREVPLRFFTWDQFTSSGLDRNQSPGTPQVVTQTDTGEVMFWPAPARTYTCRFSYTKNPQTFSADADVPTGLPSRFHRVIAWAAVMKYALYDEQPALLRRAEQEYSKLMRKMRRDLLPKISISTDYRGW